MTIYFIGNSNNEMARIAHEFSKVSESKIELILIQKLTLNDPIGLPYFEEFEKRIKIRDFKMEGKNY